MGYARGPPLSCQVSPDNELDLTCAEVGSAVSTLQAGKTTARSKDSAHLLKNPVGTSFFGRNILTKLLNVFFKTVALNMCIWLLGGSFYFQKMLGLLIFSLIVCGEVFTKQAAKLATCFGCVGGHKNTTKSH